MVLHHLPTNAAAPPTDALNNTNRQARRESPTYNQEIIASYNKGLSMRMFRRAREEDRSNEESP